MPSLALAFLLWPLPARAQEVPRFFAEAPAGYQASSATLSGPLLAFYVKRLPDGGESALLVEHYARGEGDAEVPVELGLPPRAFPARRIIDGRPFEIYESLKTQSPGRPLAASDPYADALGERRKPPRVRFLSATRFHPGGDAYRLYRCRKRGAWRLLAKYRRLKEAGADLYVFCTQELGASERRVISACFGHATLSAMLNAQELPEIDKPSYADLRAVAGKERAMGSSPVIERGSVHLRPHSGGVFLLRLRAPKAAYARERLAFERFVGAFELLAGEP